MYQSRLRVSQLQTMTAVGPDEDGEEELAMEGGCLLS